MNDIIEGIVSTNNGEIGNEPQNNLVTTIDINAVHHDRLEENDIDNIKEKKIYRFMQELEDDLDEIEMLMADCQIEGNII